MPLDGRRHRGPDLLLHEHEIRPHVVDAERSREEAFISPSEQLRHVAEVVETVVDRRCGEHEELLRTGRAFEHVVELAISRWALLSLSRKAGIAEVVGFVDDDRVGLLPNLVHHIRPVHIAGGQPIQVGVVDNAERNETAQ